MLMAHQFCILKGLALGVAKLSYSGANKMLTKSEACPSCWQTHLPVFLQAMDMGLGSIMKKDPEVPRSRSTYSHRTCVLIHLIELFLGVCMHRRASHCIPAQLPASTQHANGSARGSISVGRWSCWP